MHLEPEDLVSRVTSLLAAKADVNAKGNEDDTALIGASWQGHLGVVRALLATGSDCERQE